MCQRGVVVMVSENDLGSKRSNPTSTYPVRRLHVSSVRVVALCDVTFINKSLRRRHGEHDGWFVCQHGVVVMGLGKTIRL